MTNADAKSLSGTRVIVTGASSGVGKATAQLFASRGAKVALIARRADILTTLAKELGNGALALEADVADDEAVERVVDEAVDRFGGLDVAINCAAIDGPVPLADLTPKIWRRQIDVNLSGTYYVARKAALHMMSRDGGSIVNVGSELSLIGMGLYVHYCASKFGVVGLTKALAHELAPKVRVNCICPGPIDTPMMDAELECFPDPITTRAAAIDRVPLKRFATPKEVARAILFIATEAPFATGSAISIDGGTTAV
jgi:NAD(P)-dependent dehydrogenase (short-subunit alcohol dehydrogenase family)